MPRRERRVSLVAMRFGVAALTALVLLSCGGANKGGSQPSWRKSSVAATSSERVPVDTTFIELAANGRTVSSYNSPPRTEAPSSALSTAVLTAIGETSAALGLAPPVPDGRLYQALQELAEIAPLDTPLTYSLLEFALQRNGIIEPSPLLVLITGDMNQPGPIVTELADGLADTLRTGRFKRVGVGAAKRGDQDLILVAFQESNLETQPIAKEIPAGGSLILEGRIDSGFTKPHLYHTTEAGQVLHLGLSQIGATGFRARFECGARVGKQQLEITAEDRSGSTVLANFPVWCASRAPLSLRVTTGNDDPSPRSRGEAEERMFNLVNSDRASHGLPPLLRDERLVQISRLHSDEMLRTGQVAHVSPTSGSAADRVKAGGVRTSVVLENVARAYGVAEAERGLMNSPGHRANILSEDVTHLGIGITLGEDVSGRKELLVTQVFMRVPTKIVVETVRAQVAAKIHSSKVMSADLVLQGIAQAFASDLAKGESTNFASQRANKSLDRNAGGFARVSTLVTSVADIASFDPRDSLGDAQVKFFGIGIAQGNHPVMGDDAIYIVILLAQR